MQKAKDIYITEALERAFWARTLKKGDNECWPWQGTINDKGYGILGATDRNYRAHRISYCIHHHVTNLPDGYEPDHLCRYRACVNPFHLEAVPSAVNYSRGIGPSLLSLRRQRTHCPNGHVYTLENTYTSKKKTGGYLSKQCKTCNIKMGQERRVQRRAARNIQ